MRGRARNRSKTLFITAAMVNDDVEIRIEASRALFLRFAGELQQLIGVGDDSSFAPNSGGCGLFQRRRKKRSGGIYFHRLPCPSHLLFSRQSSDVGWHCTWNPDSKHKLKSEGSDVPDVVIEGDDQFLQRWADLFSRQALFNRTRIYSKPLLSEMLGFEARVTLKLTTSC
jgi:hypothetical protein